MTKGGGGRANRRRRATRRALRRCPKPPTPLPDAMSAAFAKLRRAAEPHVVDGKSYGTPALMVGLLGPPQGLADAGAGAG